MARVSWEAQFARLATDPAPVLDELRAEEEVLKARLAEVRRRLVLATKVAAASQEWLTLGADSSDPDDDPPAAELPAVEGEDVSTTGSPTPNVVGIAKRPRRQQVLDLVGQDPTRWWKTREIGEALEIANLKSLRVTLSKMADQGDLVKNADASYRFNDGRAAASSESSRDGRSAVM